MNNIQLYSNAEFSVRTTRDIDGTVWFVARDVAEALEYSESSLDSLNKLLASVPEIWTGRKRFLVRSENGVVQEREMLCLTEQGVYFFLGRSDKPKALPYQMWIAGDVVPSIRRTGGYSIHKSNGVISRGEIESVAFLYEYAGLKGNQATLALDKYIKSCTGRSALEAGGIELIAPAKKQLLTPTEIGKRLGLSACRVNELLAGAGYQYKIAGRWEALELGEPYAEMLDTNKKHSDGTPVVQLKWRTDIIPIVEQLLEASA